MTFKDAPIHTAARAGRLTGARHPLAVLTEHDVDAIRSMREAGETYADIAEKFEVSKSLIVKICRFERRITAD